jgi:membrane protein implicated in regulation of membrane protease activity
MTEFVASYGWIVWLGLVLVFGVIEMLTLDLIFLMLGIGSIGGLIADLLGAPWWVQILVAAVVAIALLAFLRPPLLHRLKRGGDPAKSNVEALLGLHGRAVTRITGDGGQARLDNGDTWTARVPQGAETLEVHAGQQITVVEIQGATAIVIPDSEGDDDV